MRYFLFFGLNRLNGFSFLRSFAFIRGYFFLAFPSTNREYTLIYANNVSFLFFFYPIRVYWRSFAVTFFSPFI